MIPPSDPASTPVTSVTTVAVEATSVELVPSLASSSSPQKLDPHVGACVTPPSSLAPALAEAPAAKSLQIDPAAVLAALVLAPGTLPRNRFYEMYKQPALRGVRRRASELRELIQQVRDRSSVVIHHWCDEGTSGRTPSPTSAHRVEYEIPSLRYRRTLWLDPSEAAIVEVALARCRAEPAPAEAESRVLSLLSQRLVAA